MKFSYGECWLGCAAASRSLTSASGEAPFAWVNLVEGAERSNRITAAGCLIATVMTMHDATLIHCDSDFERIAGQAGMKTIGWTSLLHPVTHQSDSKRIGFDVTSPFNAAVLDLASQETVGRNADANTTNTRTAATLFRIYREVP